MNKLSSILLILFLNTFFKIPVFYAQNPEKLYNKLEVDLLINNSKNVLQKVDSILLTKNNFSKELLLDFSALKMEAIVQSGPLIDALKLSNKLLKERRLSERSEVRLRIQRALIFEFFNEPDEALKEFTRLEKIYKTRKKDQYFGQYLYRKSSYYRILKPVSKSDSLSTVFAKSANDFGEKYNYYKVSGTAKMLQSFSLNPDQIENKIKLLEGALHDFKLLKNTRYQSMIYLNIAQLNINQKKNQNAIKFLDSALTISIKKNDIYYKSKIYQKKSELFEEQQLLDSSFFYYKKFHEAEMEINIEKQNLEIAKENFTNEIKKQQATIKTSKLDLVRLKKYNLNLLLFLSLLLLLLIIIVVLFRKNLSKKKEINLQNDHLKTSILEKEILLKELNHRVKNNLSLILSLIKFQIQEIDDDFYLEKFKHLENRIAIIAIAHEQFIYSENNIEGSFYNLEEYLSKISNSLINLSTKKIIYNQKVQKIDLNLDTALPIGVLINELIGNSLVHAKVDGQLQIDVEISSQNNWITILFSDSGKNFKVKENTTSLGIFIIESMVTQLEGSLIRKGSNYTIKLKKK